MINPDWDGHILPCGLTRLLSRSDNGRDPVHVGAGGRDGHRSVVHEHRHVVHNLPDGRCTCPSLYLRWLPLEKIGEFTPPRPCHLGKCDDLSSSGTFMCMRARIRVLIV